MACVMSRLCTRLYSSTSKTARWLDQQVALIGGCLGQKFLLYSATRKRRVRLAVFWAKEKTPGKSLLEWQRSEQEGTTEEGPQVCTPTARQKWLQTFSSSESESFLKIPSLLVCNWTTLFNLFRGLGQDELWGSTAPHRPCRHSAKRHGPASQNTSRYKPVRSQSITTKVRALQPGQQARGKSVVRTVQNYRTVKKSLSHDV